MDDDARMRKMYGDMYKPGGRRVVDKRVPLSKMSKVELGSKLESLRPSVPMRSMDGVYRNRGRGKGAFFGAMARGAGSILRNMMMRNQPK